MRAAVFKNLLRSREWRCPPLLLILAPFHASTPSLSRRSSDISDSENRFRFSVRQKRSDARSALKDFCLNGTSIKQYFQPTCKLLDSDESTRVFDITALKHFENHFNEDITWNASRKSSRSMRVEDNSCDSYKHQKTKNAGKHQKVSDCKKGKYGKSWRRRDWQSFDDDDDFGHPYSKFSANAGGQRSFTWSFNSEEKLQFENIFNGFEWRDDSQQTKSKRRVWRESDIEEEESCDIGLQSYRHILGLPLAGPLTLEDVKCAFHASALKWHPDKHRGPSQAVAEEKFKACADAYKSLCTALKSS